jgi:hypothetical protein
MAISIPPELKSVLFTFIEPIGKLLELNENKQWRPCTDSLKNLFSPSNGEWYDNYFVWNLNVEEDFENIFEEVKYANSDEEFDGKWYPKLSIQYHCLAGAVLNDDEIEIFNTPAGQVHTEASDEYFSLDFVNYELLFNFQCALRGQDTNLKTEMKILGETYSRIYELAHQSNSHVGTYGSLPPSAK